LSYTTLHTLLCPTTYDVDCASRTWLKLDTELEMYQIPHSAYNQDEVNNFSQYGINKVYQTFTF